MKLPHNVAVVRACEGKSCVTVVSDTLTRDQKVAARVLVALLAGSRAYAMLMVADVVAALAAA